MPGQLGFSYTGAVYLLLLFVPNLFWTKYRPEGYSAQGESRFLQFLERVGECAVTVICLIFSDFNPRFDSLWIGWLFASALSMLLYEVFWIRYFRSKRQLSDFYSSLLNIPVAGATLPVLAFALLGVYGRNIWLLLSAAVLGIGHIGIHLAHRTK